LKQKNKILVLTDNRSLLLSFRALANSFEETYEFDYAFSPKNPAPDDFIKEGCFQLNIKENYEKLIGKYSLIFSIHCKQIFPKELVSKVECINLHPGYNPYNRGWFPQVFCILNGKKAGATLHVMNSDIDSGPIIAQTEVKIESWDTSLSAYDKIQKAEIELLSKNLNSILTASFTSHIPETGNYNSIGDFKAINQIRLEETGTFKEFLDRLRALTHPPYKNAYYITPEGEKVYISIQLSKENN